MSGTVHLTQVSLDELPLTGHPLTSAQWAAIKRMNGWDAHPFYISSLNRYILLLSKKILPYHIGYVPYLDLENVDSALLRTITDEIRSLISLPFLFIRYELAYGTSYVRNRALKRVVSCPYTIQPVSSVFVDVNRNIEDLRKAYAKRAKRALRKSHAALADCIISDNSEADFDEWYTLYRETSVRDGFSARGKDYIRGVLSQEGAHLFLAIRDQKIVGGVITLESEDVLLYLFGATARDLPFPVGYLLQDEVIAYACDSDLICYDLHGIGEGDDHLSSLTLFKTSFTGKIVRREKSIDVMVKPLLYRLYRLAEGFRISRGRSH